MNKLNMKEVMKHIQDHVQLVNIRVGILNPFLSSFFNKKKKNHFFLISMLRLSKTILTKTYKYCKLSFICFPSL